jgi:integrative and conjugative element protein (TIGR02256 family)
MARSLHSNDYEENQEPLCRELIEDLEVLRVFLGKRGLKLLRWDEHNVVVPLGMDVRLPPRGNYEDIDIRAKEDVLFVFHRTKYPEVAPRVYSDRKSFPKDGLSHLYVSAKDAPAPFCLVRGNYNEWFATKRIVDLIIRVRNWLGDAANGALVEDGGQFDPMRLEGYRGSIIYKYEELAEVVEKKILFGDERNFAFLLIREKEKPGIEGDKVKYPGYEIVGIITKVNQLMESYKPAIEKMIQHEAGLSASRLLIGAVVWNEQLKVNSQFPTELPKDLNSLIDFCEQAGVDLMRLLELIPPLKIYGIDEVPILVGIKRPKPLIGYNGEIEFFNYYLTFREGTIVDNVIKKNLQVGFQKHNEPLSIKKAKQVAGSSGEVGRAVVFGCGAVGSKIITHLIREGHVDGNILLFDQDKVEPHNMVRYGLMTDAIGVNKAVALENAAKQLFAADKDSVKVYGFPLNGNTFFELGGLKKCLSEFDWVMDFTASTSFENYFIRQNLESNNKVVRASLTDEGRLGMLLVEGPDRNPRIDDLKILCQADYLDNPAISEYLKREYANSKKDSLLINVGVGCNSETTIIADDTITLHCAAFLKVIKFESKVNNMNLGVVQLTYLDSDNGFSIRSERREVAPLTVFKDDKTNWEVRMKEGLDTVLMAEMGKAMPIETGGVFIGIVNNKTKCIHITDVILAPPDSEANEGCFIRGIEGLKDQVDSHKKKSGQTFGYIGEWHTHPHGPYGPSTKDQRTMNEFKRKYAKEGLAIPVFVMIVTPMGLITCIY